MKIYVFASVYIIFSHFIEIETHFIHSVSVCISNRGEGGKRDLGGEQIYIYIYTHTKKKTETHFIHLCLYKSERERERLSERDWARVASLSLRERGDWQTVCYRVQLN